LENGVKGIYGRVNPDFGGVSDLRGDFEHTEQVPGHISGEGGGPADFDLYGSDYQSIDPAYK
jgi:hypothetical protein